MAEIDFARGYRERVARSGRAARAPEYWDQRADRMSRTAFDAPYVAAFVARLDLRDCRTLLDVGCGPGTIGLSVAGHLEHVYGLDYSREMLAAFEEHARQRGLTNATPIRLAWEDDWCDVPVCDVVVASRSTAVADLEAAFLKLESKARRRVYITYPADGHFAGDALCRSIGRPGQALPDYLYPVGILHDLGRYPTLDYLFGDNRLARCATFEEFAAKVGDLLGALTPEETVRLRDYYDAHHERMAREPMRWALCSWEPPATAPR